MVKITLVSLCSDTLCGGYGPQRSGNFEKIPSWMELSDAWNLHDDGRVENASGTKVLSVHDPLVLNMELYFVCTNRPYGGMTLYSVLVEN